MTRAGYKLLDLKIQIKKLKLNIKPKPPNNHCVDGWVENEWNCCKLTHFLMQSIVCKSKTTLVYFWPSIQNEWNAQWFRMHFLVVLVQLKSIPYNNILIDLVYMKHYE
jgi:hypothetical protein